MFNRNILFLSLAILTANVYAQTTPINGTVQSRCIIQTDSAGVYGNPNAYTLTTARTDGGLPAVIRIDVSLADAYYADITSPTSFSTSPSLPDIVYWTGDTTVKAMSDIAGMGSYEANKIQFNNTDRYDLTATGSTWFSTESIATMGGNKPFPGGDYTALVIAECIAK